LRKKGDKVIKYNHTELIHIITEVQRVRKKKWPRVNRERGEGGKVAQFD